MDDSRIREKLAAKFRTGELPRSMPSALHPSTLEGYEAIEINVGRGKRCCVCDEMITLADKGSMEFKYPDGRSFVFHQRCEQVWQEERQKPLPRSRGDAG